LSRPSSSSGCEGANDEGFDHGKPYTFVHEGQEIKLCCKDCLADFKKEPSKYLSKLTSK
jgi:YHS domain-containing protein